MKKFVKVISAMCLAFILCLPLMLAGCAKNYTVYIKVVGEGGGVYSYTKNSGQSKSVANKRNSVKEGSKFEYQIVPNNGYYIDKIIIDGVEKDKSTYDQTRVILSFDDVHKNHKVEVSFVKHNWTVTFMYYDDAEESWKEYTTWEILHDTALDLSEYPDDIYWYIITGTGKYYLTNGENEPTAEPTQPGFTNGPLKNRITNVTKDLVVRTDLNYEQLAAKFPKD